MVDGLELKDVGHGEYEAVVDGRAFSAHMEDGLIIVHGVSENGATLPVPRAGMIVRVDSSAHLQMFGKSGL